MNKETLQRLVQVAALYSTLINTGNFILNLNRYHHDLPKQHPSHAIHNVLKTERLQNQYALRAKTDLHSSAHRAGW